MTLLKDITRASYHIWKMYIARKQRNRQVYFSAMNSFWEQFDEYEKKLLDL